MIRNYKENGVIKMAIEEIEKLQHYHTRLTTVLNELAVLADGDGFNYDEFIVDLGFITRGLELRRERLLKRGKRL